MHIINISLILLSLGLALSCGKAKQIDTQQQNTQLLSRVDSLEGVVELRDSIISDVLTLVSSISTKLDDIKQQEGIAINSGEIGLNSKDKLEKDLSKLSQRLVDNRKALEQLEGVDRRLADNNIKIASLQSLLDRVKFDMQQSNRQTVALLQELGEMTMLVDSVTGEITTLEENNTLLTQTLIEQQRRADARYYIIGTRKDLQNQGVIEKVRGWSSERKLASGVDYSKLISININEIDTIPFVAKREKIIGSFSTSSYKIIEENNQKAVVIVDREEFWRDTKVLVIVVE